MSTVFTVFFESPYWVGVLERHDEAGFWIGKHIFGGEPSNAELWIFALNEFAFMRVDLVDSANVVAGDSEKRLRSNGKKAQHKATKAQSKGINSYTHLALQSQLDLIKKERTVKSKSEMERESERQFELKQLKRREKHRGH